jgi:hypothetical protein
LDDLRARERARDPADHPRFTRETRGASPIGRGVCGIYDQFVNAQDPRPARDLRLDPVVLSFLLIAAPAMVIAVTRYHEARPDPVLGTDLYLGVGLALLLLAALRPFAGTRPPDRAVDDNVDAIKVPADDVSDGERVATWAMLTVVGVGSATLLYHIASPWLAILPPAMLIGLLVTRMANRPFDVEAYVMPVFVVLRPTRIVLLLLGTYAVISGLTAHDRRNGMLLVVVAVALMLAVWLDGAWVPVRRRSGDDRIRAENARLRERVRQLSTPTSQSTPEEKDARPLPTWTRVLLVLVVSSVAVVVLWRALVPGSGATTLAGRDLLIFAGGALALAVIGDRLSKITFDKDGFSAVLEDFSGDGEVETAGANGSQAAGSQASGAAGSQPAGEAGSLAAAGSDVGKTRAARTFERAIAGPFLGERDASAFRAGPEATPAPVRRLTLRYTGRVKDPQTLLRDLMGRADKA